MLHILLSLFLFIHNRHVVWIKLFFKVSRAKLNLESAFMITVVQLKKKNVVLSIRRVKCDDFILVTFAFKYQIHRVPINLFQNAFFLAFLCWEFVSKTLLRNLDRIDLPAFF